MYVCEYMYMIIGVVFCLHLNHSSKCDLMVLVVTMIYKFMYILEYMRCEMLLAGIIWSCLEIEMRYLDMKMIEVVV